MISDKQLQANRSNALKSTGPKTVEGKLIASKNATTHGLLSNHVVIKGESNQEFEGFRNLLIDHFQPVGILEQLLTNRIVASFWRLNRSGRIEVEILNSMLIPKQRSAGKGAMPFIVKFTQTYEGIPGEYEEPIDEKPEKISENNSRSDIDEPAELTLGQAVLADFKSGNILDKFHRYKGHIDKTLYKSLHELQRLQSTRYGQHVNPPQVLDIEISSGEQ